MGPASLQERQAQLSAAAPATSSTLVGAGPGLGGRGSGEVDKSQGREAEEGSNPGESWMGSGLTGLKARASSPHGTCSNPTSGSADKCHQAQSSDVVAQGHCPSHWALMPRSPVCPQGSTLCLLLPVWAVRRSCGCSLSMERTSGPRTPWVRAGVRRGNGMLGAGRAGTWTAPRPVSG